jgi:hypothetical protein
MLNDGYTDSHRRSVRVISAGVEQAYSLSSEAAHIAQACVDVQSTYSSQRIAIQGS